MSNSNNHAWKIGYNGGTINTNGLPHADKQKIDAAVNAGAKAAGRR